VHQGLKPGFETPEAAIETLLRAYHAKDLEAMVAAKDFAIDAQLFWEDLGLPVTDNQMEKSVTAFESNFRKQMEHAGIPDYDGMEYRITNREDLQDNCVLLTLHCRFPDGQAIELELPTFLTSSGWKAVNIPVYDHL